MRYYGIKQLYPRLRFLGVKLRAVLSNSRPFTLLLPLVGGYFVVQTSLGHWTIPTPDPLKTALALLALMMVNAGGNNVNAIFDVEIDRVNKPYRPIPSGLLSRTEAGVVAAKLFLLALAKAYFVNTTFFLLLTVLVLATIFYSAPPLRLKQFLWTNNIHQAFIRGVLGVLAAWSIFSPLTIQTVAMASVMFFLILPSQASKDFGDVAGDTEFRIRTLPVIYGPSKAILYMKLLLLMPFVLVLAWTWAGVFPIWTLTFMFLAPITWVFVHSLMTPSQKLENTKGWALFYGLMLASLGIFSLVL